MKRLVLGDIHGHWDTLKFIYEQENPDEVIILGDYFDNFHGSSQSIVDCFDNILSLRREHIKNKPGQFILLIGNHDYHYMNQFETYSGYRSEYAVQTNIKLNELFDDKVLKYVFVDDINRTIYSHAGVTNTWLKENRLNDVDLNFINDANPRAFKFTYAGGGDCYGCTVYASPIWVRPDALQEDLYSDETGVWTQIVGHTHTWEPYITEDKSLYVIDTLPDFYIVEELNDNKELISRTVKSNF